jgi:hypothetical protein
MNNHDEVEILLVGDNRNEIDMTRFAARQRRLAPGDAQPGMYWVLLNQSQKTDLCPNP